MARCRWGRRLHHLRHIFQAPISAVRARALPDTGTSMAVESTALRGRRVVSGGALWSAARQRSFRVPYGSNASKLRCPAALQICLFAIVASLRFVLRYGVVEARVSRAEARWRLFPRTSTHEARRRRAATHATCTDTNCSCGAELAKVLRNGWR